MRSAISHARDRFEDVSATIEEIVDGRLPSELEERDLRRLKPARARQKSAMENLLNAYENSCMKYLDDKIDKKRFKQTYFAEIRRIFEPPDNAFKTFLHPEGISKFKALWKVYREWYDVENNPG